MDAASVYGVDLPANKMSKVEILQGIITERMTTAVREILAVIETTVTGYEADVLLLQRDLRHYKRKLHALLQPQIHLTRVDLDGVGTPDITAAPTHSIELTHVQKGEENNDCIASEKCIGENEVDGPAKTVSQNSELEESDCALADDSESSSAFREEGLTDDSVNNVHNKKGKRRRQLPEQYRSNNNMTDGDSDGIEKNSDNEWKPNKNKKLRSSNVKKNRLIKLRVGLLNSPGTDLSNNAFSLESPVQTTMCQQNLTECDFINQLRSIFPELGENTPFDAYLDNSTNKSVPHLSNKMTLNELYKAFKAQEQKRFDFYLQKREHGDTLTNTTLLFVEKPTTNGLEEATPLETEGTSNLRDEMCNIAVTMDSTAKSDDDDDDDWKPTQNSKDEEHSADPKSEKNDRKDTGEQRLNCDTCQVCGYIFRSSTLLTKHALSHLDNPKRKCGVCGKQFESSEELKTHLETHQKLHQCEICGRYFVSFVSLQKHIDTHRIEKPCQCNICQKVFASNKLLKEHKLHHRNYKPYKCDMCPQSYKFKTGLDNHYRKHTDDKLYCCDVCGKSLTTYRGLSQHKLIHSGEKNYSCQQCGKKFYTEMFRKRHEKVHTVREKKHLCDICSKTFLSKDGLESHLKMHNNSNIVKCSICDKFLRGHIYGHMKTHTGEKPFGCKECGKKFKCKAHLETHTLVIHDNIKPLTCTLCGYKCARKHYLDSHMRTHTGHKPYKCTLCDQAFTQSHCLKKHMNSHQTEDQC